MTEEPRGLLSPGVKQALVVAVPWAIVCAVVSGGLGWKGLLFIGFLMFISLYGIMRAANEESLVAALRQVPLWMEVVSLVVASALLLFPGPWPGRVMLWFTGGMYFAALVFWNVRKGRRRKRGEAKDEG